MSLAISLAEILMFSNVEGNLGHPQLGDIEFETMTMILLTLKTAKDEVLSDY